MIQVEEHLSFWKKSQHGCSTAKKTVEMGQMQIHFWDVYPKNFGGKGLQEAADENFTDLRKMIPDFFEAPKWRWIEDDFLFKKWCFLGSVRSLFIFRAVSRRKWDPEWSERINSTRGVDENISQFLRWRCSKILPTRTNTKGGPLPVI